MIKISFVVYTAKNGWLACSKRGWFSGRIVPCHGTDPGSIPGSRMLLFSTFLFFAVLLACVNEYVYVRLALQAASRTQKDILECTVSGTLSCSGGFLPSMYTYQAWVWLKWMRCSTSLRAQVRLFCQRYVCH